MSLAGERKMPGIGLSFKCICGFHKDNIKVGATEDGHYTVFLCAECKNIFSSWISCKKSDDRICRKCGKRLMAVTDDGAWQPEILQQKFPNIEPWIVENEIYDYAFDDIECSEEIENFYISNIENIRILCPRCGKYTLKFENTMLWD